MSISNGNNVFSEVNYEEQNDYFIYLKLANDETTMEEREYIMNNHISRVNKMDLDLFLQMLTVINGDFCERFKTYLASKIQSLGMKQVESILYTNKYEHQISALAEHLVEQPWFKDEASGKYKSFVLSYLLEKALKANTIDRQKLEDIGSEIVGLLASNGHNPTVSNMIMNNYIFLLSKHYPEYFEEFKKQGYAAIDQQIANEQELTPNMIVFDCNIAKIEKDLGEFIQYLEFYEDENDISKFASYQRLKIRINTESMKELYRIVGDKTVGSIMLLFFIRHEQEHAFCDKYRTIGNKNTDPITNLRMFNACQGEGAHVLKGDKVYREYHDFFTHEYEANINGIRTFYDKLKFLPSLRKEDKEAINKLFAKYLFSSYSASDGEKDIYVNPVEFTRVMLEDSKDNLPGYVSMQLLDGQKDLPIGLANLEKNLSEYEKFLLGYYNKYIGILKMIADGEINVSNLFEELPALYERHKDAIKGKFPSYYAKEEQELEQQENNKKEEK